MSCNFVMPEFMQQVAHSVSMDHTAYALAWKQVRRVGTGHTLQHFYSLSG